MSQKDTIHQAVKAALVKDGWQITADPYTISYGERFLFVDLGAANIQSADDVDSQFIGAEQDGKHIAVEIKGFRGQSPIEDLEQAIGQYVLYRLLLQQVDPERILYLAITDMTYADIFSEPIGKLVISGLSMKLLIVNIARTEVKQWIL